MKLWYEKSDLLYYTDAFRF